MELLSKPAAVIPRLLVAIVPLLAKSAATILALPKTVSVSFKPKTKSLAASS